MPSPTARYFEQGLLAAGQTLKRIDVRLLASLIGACERTRLSRRHVPQHKLAHGRSRRDPTAARGELRLRFVVGRELELRQDAFGRELDDENALSFGVGK